MSWRNAVPVLLLSFATPAMAAEGYVLGGGLERDSEGSLGVAALGELGVTAKTWLSATLASNSVELSERADLETVYADLGIDHWLEPIGLRAAVAYWGDDDTLDSMDWRASLYWRSDKPYLSVDFEYRDFSFQLPASGQFSGRELGFDASGLGIAASFDVTDDVSLGLAGMDYDYSVNLGTDRNRSILQLASFSRLSLINSLVDYRVFATLGVAAGERRWQFDVGSWKGEVDGATTRSATVRFLTPLGERHDIEFALGIDDSELYGDASFLSVFLYFYGGS
ncbi:MAG: hypothetical protein HKN64_06000 [Woeseiaceae bacterium]|nr:hypothetical protein [Woeseiaceae bacterium]